MSTTTFTWVTPTTALQPSGNIKVTVTGSGPANAELEVTFNSAAVVTIPSPAKTDSLGNYSLSFETANPLPSPAQITIREKGVPGVASTVTL